MFRRRPTSATGNVRRRVRSAADLYEGMIRRRLARDDGKHRFTHRHKRLMMEEIAEAMWRDGAREWPWDRGEKWLDQFLARHPEIAGRYRGIEPEILNEDFRTASVLSV